MGRNVKESNGIGLSSTIQLINLSDEKIFNNLEILCSNDLQKIKKSSSITNYNLSQKLYF